jgi:hypothetical protein
VDIIVGVGCTIRKRGGVSPLDDDRLSQGALTAYRDGKLIDWLDELTADCSKKQAHNMNDPCGARCPDLPRVL